jgi:hypothetical protein
MPQAAEGKAGFMNETYYEVYVKPDNGVDSTYRKRSS